jgi:hypothetical protein
LLVLGAALFAKFASRRKAARAGKADSGIPAKREE